jgi:glyoxylase-like metal-dependent hydrolase (beta-lactamase superfamily II)
VSILLTAPWHERSSRAVVDRYSGRVWAASPARGRLGDVPELEMLPPGIWSFVPAGVDEGQVAFLIEPEQTLIVGEIFAGVNRGLELRPSPATNDEKAFLASLAELEALPIRRVLVGHGSPVLEGGNEAISAALRAFTKS